MTQNAIRRLSAFNLLDFLFEVSQTSSLILAETFTSLQADDKGRNIIHYTEGIKGCGLSLEEKLQGVVFSILGKVKQAMEEKPDMVLLHALEWKFSARDFVPLLGKLPIFQILSQASPSSFSTLLNETQFEKKKLTVFKEVFFSICARIASGEAI